MVGLDADKLELLQQKWNKITASTPAQFEKNLENFESLVIGLRDLGLHTAYDSTYELLSPGLDREQFRQKRTEMFLLQALNTYHGTRRITDDNFLGNISRRQQKSMRQLLMFDLPAYETHVASTGLSDDLSPLLVQEINDLRALKKSGKLDQELARLNVECVKDAFRNAYTMNADQEKEFAKGGEPNYRATKMALAFAQAAVKGLDDLGGRLTASQIPVEFDNAGYWTDKRVSFDRAAIVGVRDSLLLRSCRIELQEALAYQEQGHFVVDTAKRCSEKVLPLQNIVQTLTAHKYNMQVPATFAAMGTTPDKFWAAYQRECQAVAASPIHADRLAPEFKPGR